MDSTLNLIYLAFVLKLPVASNVAGCFLDLAFAFFRCTLYMFVVHITPLQSEMRLSPDRGCKPKPAELIQTAMLTVTPCHRLWSFDEVTANVTDFGIFRFIFQVSHKRPSM